MWTDIKKQLTAPFPFFLNRERDNLLLAAAVGVFCFLFFQIFQPFGLSEYCTPEKSGTFSLITFSVLAFNVLITPRLFPRTFDPDRWNFLKFIVFFFWLIVSIAFSISVFVYYSGWFPSDYTGIQLFIRELTHSFTVGIIPLFVIIYLLRNRMLAANLREAKHVNERLSQIQELAKTTTIPEPQEAPSNPAPEPVASHWTINADTQDSLNIPQGAFIYAEADDNYSRIFWLEDGAVQEKLLRLTLKHLEGQLAAMNIEGLARIHRSYYVNLLRVTEVRGNASGYRLYFRDTEQELPVSRMKGKWVLNQLEGPSAALAQ